MTRPEELTARLAAITGRRAITTEMILEELVKAEAHIGAELNRTDLPWEWRGYLEDVLQEIHRQMEVALHKDPRPIFKDHPLKGKEVGP